jgi:hypothetical protein
VRCGEQVEYYGLVESWFRLQNKMASPMRGLTLKSSGVQVDKSPASRNAPVCVCVWEGGGLRVCCGCDRQAWFITGCQFLAQVVVQAPKLEDGIPTAWLDLAVFWATDGHISSIT